MGIVMMNYRKKILIKNIFIIFLYALDIAGIMFSCQMLWFFYCLKRSGKADEIGRLLEKGMTVEGFKKTYNTTVSLFIICSIMVAAMFFYLLFKLLQNMGELRSVDIGIKYVLGYRKKRVMAGEFCYDMSYILCAGSLAVLVSIVLFNNLNKVAAIGAMLRSADMKLHSVGIDVICIVAVILTSLMNTVVRVQREYN